MGQANGIPTGTGSNSPSTTRRDAVAIKPVAPFPTWADATGSITAALNAVLKDVPLQTLSGAQKDLVEMKFFGAVEDLLKALGTQGSAGRAMAALSMPEPVWPDPA